MLDRAGLGPLRKLGEGGSGDVFEIVGTGSVYKEFNQQALDHTDIRLWAAGSVAFWHSLSPAEQTELASLAVWPTDTVHDRGDLIGVVMPILPDEVFHDRVANDGSVERQLNEIKWLLRDPGRLRGRFDVAVLSDEAVRYELIGRSLQFVAWLHARGVSFGDISYGNFVFSLNPPHVLAIDTDAVVTGPTTAAVNGRQTPFYVPPELEGPHPHDRIDEKTDVWKGAILALRALTPGQGAFQRRCDDVAMLVGHAPDAVVDVLGRAMSADRALRPPMAELAGAFLTHVARLCGPPVAVGLDVAQRVVRRGGAIVLDWEFDAVDRVVVETPEGIRHDVDLTRNPRGFSFVADRSGLIAVHASNRHGTNTFPLGPVHVHEIPNVASIVELPPAPWLSPFAQLALTRIGDLPPVPTPPVAPSVFTPAPGLTVAGAPTFSSDMGRVRSRLAAQRADIERRLAQLPRR